MAQRVLNLALTIVLITAIWASSSSAQSSNCQPGIISLRPCLPFIMSNSSTPPPLCCNQLSNLDQAQCLCTLLTLTPQPPFNINQTQVANLPSACNIQAPPLSQCNAPIGSPQGAPSPASAIPLAPSGSSPPSSPTPSADGGSKEGSNNGQSSSARSSIVFSPFFFLSLLGAIAFFSY